MRHKKFRGQSGIPMRVPKRGRKAGPRVCCVDCVDAEGNVYAQSCSRFGCAVARANCPRKASDTK